MAKLWDVFLLASLKNLRKSECAPLLTLDTRQVIEVVTLTKELGAVDYPRLQSCAEMKGYRAELLCKGDNFDYLACIKRK